MAPVRPTDDIGAPKRPTNVSFSGNLLDQAHALSVTISRACEDGIAQQMADVQSSRWLDENRPAIEASNAYVECKGLPLERYRQF